jgi:hypothetical protein
MSLVSTVANYGGKQPDNNQNTKQFIVGADSTSWIYKRLPSGLLVLTPSKQNIPVLINGDLYVNGSIYNPSDKNLKKNVKDVENNQFEGLLNLEPVEFIYKDDMKQKQHFGFIAQDFEKIYPELVTQNDYGYKSVNYIELIPLLVSKIQNQQKEIDDLKELITSKI